jgi:hypothetical protein
MKNIGSNKRAVPQERREEPFSALKARFEMYMNAIKC